MKKIYPFFLIHFWLSLIFAFCSATGISQTIGDSDRLAEPVINDSTSIGYDDYEEESYNPDSKRLNANAFDTLPAYVPAPIRKTDRAYIQRLQNHPDFSYARNGLTQPPETRGSDKSPGVDINKTISYIAILVFIVILFWYLKENKLLLFKGKSASLLTVPTEELTEKDLFSTNFPDAIYRARANRNFRLAIRLHYLQVLRLLSEKEIISYQPDKTNFDYLLQLRSQEYYPDFVHLTKSYEYSWYGLFPVSEQQFQKIENGFTGFHKKIQA